MVTSYLPVRSGVEYDGRLRTNVGNAATLGDAVATPNPTERISGQTIICVRPSAIRAHTCNILPKVTNS